MSEGTYTPGPWKWFTSNSHMRLSSMATGRDGDVVGAYKAADGMAVVNVKKADADLIAVAPELLDALQETVNDLVAYQVNARNAAKINNRWEGVADAVQPSIDRARESINKALGR